MDVTQSEKALCQAWDQVAGPLDTIPIAGERVRYAAAIKPLLVLSKNARILEAGCGSGRLLRALAALGYRQIVGLEISPARLEQVSRLGPPEAGLVCAEQVPFASESFDAVVSAAVIEHVTDPPGWLAELARVAKPDGLVSIATDTYMWHWLEQLGLYRSIQPIDQTIWPGSLIHWANEAGLILEGCGGFVNTPDQRFYFLKQLMRLLPNTDRLQTWLDRTNRVSTTSLRTNEAAAVVEAAHTFPEHVRIDFWACVWSYECFYWFRKS